MNQCNVCFFTYVLKSISSAVVFIFVTLLTFTKITNSVLYCEILKHFMRQNVHDKPFSEMKHEPDLPFFMTSSQRENR